MTKASEDMMSLMSEEVEIFEQRLAMARKQLEDVKKGIAVLREKRQASFKVYNAACMMLGKANHFANEIG